MTGARFWFGPSSAWGMTVALNTNLNVLFNHGVNPNPFGGILGVTLAAAVCPARRRRSSIPAAAGAGG